MNNKKAVLVLLCVAALVAASVFGTLAYLTDTDAVTNTFTVGNVGLKLDEAKVKSDGTYVTDHDNRGETNAYHLLPGHTYCKDPTVTVDADSEEAYVRMIVKVANINKLMEALPNSGDTAKYYGEDGTFLLQMLCLDETGKCTWDSSIWKMFKYELVDDAVGIYEFRYHKTVAKSENETVLEDLFTHITVPGEIDNDHLAHLASVQIDVNAHAIQADGFDTDVAAWKAFDGQVGK